MFLRIESLLLKYSDANIDQFYVLKGVSSGVSSAQATRPCGSGERGAPDGTRELADGQSLLAARLGLKHRSGPKMSTSMDIETSGACGDESRESGVR